MLNNRLREAFFVFGRLISPLYSLVMRLRAALYARGLLPSTRLSLPVISVGNLSMGGTGKTPMVIYLARLLAGQRRPGIVSRGYGGRSRQPVNLVSDGTHTLMAADQAGDEPLLLAQSLPGVAVVTARQRVLGGGFLLQQGLADILILDDGFQHLALQRDLDLVLFSAQLDVRSAWVFPGGMLREPVSALARADCFVLTGVEQDIQPEVEALRGWLRQHYPQTPLFAGSYLPVGLYCRERGWEEISILHGVPLLAFCGIAHPRSFRESLQRHFLIKGCREFADHHPFTQHDLDALVQQAIALGAAALITTEKDFVKIKDCRVGLPIWVLAVELRMEPGFDSFVLEQVGASGQS